MLSTLITSKTRIKLLLKFFLNSNTSGYLKNLESEFEDSSNGIRIELNKFEKAGLLITESKGNKKIFRANTKHPLFNDIHQILIKYAGIDKLIENVIEELGNIQRAYIIGSYARGIESNIIDIVIVGDVKVEYLISLISKVELLIDRKVRYVLYTNEELETAKQQLASEAHLLIWESKTYFPKQIS